MCTASRGGTQPRLCRGPTAAGALLVRIDGKTPDGARGSTAMSGDTGLGEERLYHDQPARADNERTFEITSRRGASLRVHLRRSGVRWTQQIDAASSRGYVTRARRMAPRSAPAGWPTKSTPRQGDADARAQGVG